MRAYETAMTCDKYGVAEAVEERKITDNSIRVRHRVLCAECTGVRNDI